MSRMVSMSDPSTLADVGRFLKSRFPGLARENPAVLKARIRNGARAAIGFGLTGLPQIVAFLSWQARWGDEFWMEPGRDWAADILTDTSIGPDHKIALMDSALTVMAAQKAS